MFLKKMLAHNSFQSRAQSRIRSSETYTTDRDDKNVDCKQSEILSKDQTNSDKSKVFYDSFTTTIICLLKYSAVVTFGPASEVFVPLLFPVCNFFQDKFTSL